MAARGEPKLTEPARTFAVQALACFDPPSVVVGAIRKEFGLTITPQSCEAYDPTKRAGRNLAKRWVELFHTTRSTFLESQAEIGISHRVVRLRALQRMAERAEAIGNLALAAQLYEQAAKEVGGSYSNRRELSGPGGAPIEVSANLREGLAQLPRAARDKIRAALVDGGTDD